MEMFLIILVVVWILVGATDCYHLGRAQYPRTQTISAPTDVLSLLIHIAFIAIAITCLLR